MAEFIISGTDHPFSAYLIAAGLFLVSLAFLSLFSWNAGPIGRFGYGAAILIVVAAQADIFPAIFELIAHIDVDFAAYVWFALIAASMTLFAHFSRRRSMDAYGDTEKAFIAIIPIISFVLLLKRPKNMTRIRERSTGKFVWRVIASLACGLLFLFFLNASVVPRDRVSPNVNLSNIPLERALRIQAALINAGAPGSSDGEFALVGSVAGEGELVLEYFSPEPAADMGSAVFESRTEAIVIERVCSERLFRGLIDRGAVITFEYSAFSDGGGLLEYEFRNEASDCQRRYE